MGIWTLEVTRRLLERVLRFLRCCMKFQVSPVRWSAPVPFSSTCLGLAHREISDDLEIRGTTLPGTPEEKLKVALDSRCWARLVCRSLALPSDREFETVESRSEILGGMTNMHIRTGSVPEPNPAAA